MPVSWCKNHETGVLTVMLTTTAVLLLKGTDELMNIILRFWQWQLRELTKKTRRWVYKPQNSTKSPNLKPEALRSRVLSAQASAVCFVAFRLGVPHVKAREWKLTILPKSLA